MDYTLSIRCQCQMKLPQCLSFPAPSSIRVRHPRKHCVQAMRQPRIALQLSLPIIADPLGTVAIKYPPPHRHRAENLTPTFRAEPLQSIQKPNMKASLSAGCHRRSATSTFSEHSGRPHLVICRHSLVSNLKWQHASEACFSDPSSGPRLCSNTSLVLSHTHLCEIVSFSVISPLYSTSKSTAAIYPLWSVLSPI
jgi:hypothetical protein